MLAIIAVYSTMNTVHGHHIVFQHEKEYTIMQKEYSDTKSNCVLEQTYTPDKEILLESKMVCSDGYNGPTYWELFAEFYYQGVSVPEYCRYVHGKILPKKVCLNPDGTWRY